MSNINVFTIGFTKKNAEVFFTKLKEAGVKKIIDIRLNNVSQLAGFAKKDDLAFFFARAMQLRVQARTAFGANRGYIKRIY